MQARLRGTTFLPGGLANTGQSWGASITYRYWLSVYQHRTAQRSTAQHDRAQHSAARRAQHSAAQESTAQHRRAQRSTAQHGRAEQACLVGRGLHEAHKAREARGTGQQRHFVGFIPSG